MPFNRNHVRAFLAKAEIDLFESSLGADLKARNGTDVQRRIDRTRKLRDKYRDLLRRQKLSTRVRTGSKTGQSGEANERTAKKAKAFDEALSRFESQAKHLDAAAKKVAAKAKNVTKAQPVATGKKTAKTSGNSASKPASKKTRAKTPAKKAAKTSSKSSPSSAASKRAPTKRSVPAAVMLREVLQKKRDAQALALATQPTRSRKAPALPPSALIGGVGATPPDVRATVVESRLDQAGTSRIQGHIGTQVRKAQAKRDQRG